MKDVDLVKCVALVDEFIMYLCIKEKMPSLGATAIILARLVWLNKQAGTSDNFVRLLEEVKEKASRKKKVESEPVVAAPAPAAPAMKWIKATAKHIYKVPIEF